MCLLVYIPLRYHSSCHPWVLLHATPVTIPIIISSIISGEITFHRLVCLQSGFQVQWVSVWLSLVLCYLYCRLHTLNWTSRIVIVACRYCSWVGVTINVASPSVWVGYLVIMHSEHWASPYEGCIEACDVAEHSRVSCGSIVCEASPSSVARNNPRWCRLIIWMLETYAPLVVGAHFTYHSHHVASHVHWHAEVSVSVYWSEPVPARHANVPPRLQKSQRLLLPRKDSFIKQGGIP